MLDNFEESQNLLETELESFEDQLNSYDNQFTSNLNCNEPHDSYVDPSDKYLKFQSFLFERFRSISLFGKHENINEEYQ
jgi:hypothetical protein